MKSWCHSQSQNLQVLGILSLPLLEHPVAALGAELVRPAGAAGAGAVTAIPRAALLVPPGFFSFGDLRTASPFHSSCANAL